MATLKETLENLSKTVFERQFRIDYEQLSEEVKTEVAKAITELVENKLSNPWDHQEVKYLPGEGEVWRLKVGNRGLKTDHRIFFDIDNEGIVFLAIEHRDNAY